MIWIGHLPTWQRQMAGWIEHALCCMIVFTNPFCQVPSWGLRGRCNLQHSLFVHQSNNAKPPIDTPEGCFSQLWALHLISAFQMGSLSLRRPFTHPALRSGDVTSSNSTLTRGVSGGQVPPPPQRQILEALRFRKRTQGGLAGGCALRLQAGIDW